MGKSITLNTSSKKEIINSLCIALHNDRPITFKSDEVSGTQTGKIRTMDNLHFTITGSDWKWCYSDVTEIIMNDKIQ